MLNALPRIKKWYYQWRIKRWAKRFFHDQEYKRAFDRAFSRGKSRLNVGFYSFVIYIHPFIFYKRSRGRSTQVGICKNPKKLLERDVLEHYVVSSLDETSFDIDFFSGEDLHVMKDFMKSAKQKIENAIENKNQRRLENARRTRTQMRKLLAESEVEIEGGERTKCPKCNLPMLVRGEHGSTHVCSECSSELVLVSHDQAAMLEDLNLN